MHNFLVSTIAVLLYLIAAYGWGRLATSRLDQDNRPGWAFTIASGLGIWIFIGGILNAAQFAYPPALDAILALGIMFTTVFAYLLLSKTRITTCLHDLRFASASCFKGVILSSSLANAVIVFILLFLVATLMPASAFNSHDDFQTYMPRLVRMLETGSLGGNPFDTLGVDSLGSQAFLQSFFFRYLSMSYINAFDLISCFVLCLFLLREIWLKHMSHWIFLLASLTTFVIINPMYVNVSSLYSGSLMILGTVYSFLVFSDSMRSADSKRNLSGVLFLSLFLSSLVTLKLTFVFFAVIYFVIYFGLSLFFYDKKSRTLVAISLAVLTGISLLTPWILVSLPNYISAWHLTLNGGALPVTGDPDGLFLFKIITVFSLEQGVWGGYLMAYSLIALLLGLAGSVFIIILVKSRDRMQQPHLMAVSAACIAAIVSYFINLSLFDPDTAIRYSIPILSPVASVALLMAPKSGLSSQLPSSRTSIISAGSISIIAAAVLIGGLFSQQFVDRIKRAYQQRTQISFPIPEWYMPFTKAALGQPAADWVYAFQHKIDVGRTIFSMIAVPIHFDYSRNRIFLFSEGGLMNPWFVMPLNDHPEVSRKYLSDNGIQYVIYQYQGAAIKQDSELQEYLHFPYWMFREIGDRGIKIRNIMRYLAVNSQLIYRDNKVVIFDINQRIILPPSISSVRN